MDDIIVKQYHPSPCDRLMIMESKVQALDVRLEGMKDTVVRNQTEFKERLTGLELKQDVHALEIASHRAEFRTGVGLLGFIVVISVSTLGIVLS